LYLSAEELSIICVHENVLIVMFMFLKCFSKRSKAESSTCALNVVRLGDKGLHHLSAAFQFWPCVDDLRISLSDMTTGRKVQCQTDTWWTKGDSIGAADAREVGPAGMEWDVVSAWSNGLMRKWWASICISHMAADEDAFCNFGCCCKGLILSSVTSVPNCSLSHQTACLGSRYEIGC
jgi:hypothetical protein